jgi:methionyl-tRNA synthetase
MMGPIQEFANNYPWFILVVIAWNFTLKGVALWFAARRNQPCWFAALIILNTLGILEIVYFFSLRKKKTHKFSRISIYSPSLCNLANQYNNI